jgi:hypothetical protein
MAGHSGGLLELVARGKKDVYFTTNPSTSFFHSVYTRVAPFSTEMYISKPRNIPDWGRWTEFELEHRGDLVREFYLHIDLPTWLPPTVAAINPSGIVTDLSGVSYGYCNNIGFQVIDKIQVYNDQVMLHEIHGEYLDWRLRQSYSLSTTYLVGGEIGSRPETPLAIGRSATQGTLRVPIPILGWQHLTDPGLPLVALRGTRFRIRVLLRKLEDVVIASDGRLMPSPWNSMKLAVQATKDGLVDTTSYVTLDKSAMESVHLSLEQTYVYLQSDVQVWLKSQKLVFPFLTSQFQSYTIEDNQLTAASVNNQGVFNFPMPIEFIGSVDRLLLGFRSEAATRAGQRTALSAVARTIRLNIANLDRIKQNPVSTFREFTAYWKNRRLALDLNDPSKPAELYTLTFGGYDSEAPVGTLHFTRAVLPTLYLTLAPIPFDRRNISRKTFALLYAESWNVFEVQYGRGKMMFDDS